MAIAPISADAKLANAKPADHKRLGLMLLIVLVLSAWVLLKDDAEDDDAIELADIRTNKTAAANSSQATDINQPLRQTNSIDNSPPAPTSSLAIDWQKLQREPLSNQPKNPFKVQSWLVVAKPVKTKPLPPPPPVAPPAPFTYMGKLEDSPKGLQVFLMRSGKLYSVIKGQKIDAQWRLDAEDANNIMLTYLPLNLPQVLSKAAKVEQAFNSNPINTEPASTDAAPEMNL